MRGNMNTSLKTFKRAFAFLQLILIALAAASVIQAQTSGVDLSFNAVPDKNSTQAANFILQPDNKLLSSVISSGERRCHNRIARLNTDGSLDTTFNCTICDFTLTSAILQSDGKIIVAGNTP
jgi:hypothetical protein